MKFYSFYINCSTRYVSAEDILNDSELSFAACDKCGADNLVKWGNVTPVFECETITKSRKLPDIMLYGGRMLQAFDSWSIVSENVKNLFEKEKLVGASFYPAELVFQKRGKYYQIESQYYVMSVTGRAKIDFEAMNVDCSICDTCGHFILEGKRFPLKGIYPTIIREDTWDGADVFSDDDCTEKFVRKVLEANLTGFEFIPFEQKYVRFDQKVFFKTLNEFNKLK